MRVFINFTNSKNGIRVEFISYTRERKKNVRLDKWFRWISVQRFHFQKLGQVGDEFQRGWHRCWHVRIPIRRIGNRLAHFGKSFWTVALSSSTSPFEGKGRKRKSRSIDSVGGTRWGVWSCERTSLWEVWSLVIACQRYAKRYESICTGSLEKRLSSSIEIRGEAVEVVERWRGEEKGCLEWPWDRRSDLRGIHRGS